MLKLCMQVDRMTKRYVQEPRGLFKIPGAFSCRGEGLRGRFNVLRGVTEQGRSRRELGEQTLIQNLNLLSAKLWFSWLRAVLGLFFVALGAANWGVLGPLCLGILHHATHLALRGFDTKSEPFISRTLDFMA